MRTRRVIERRAYDVTSSRASFDVGVAGVDHGRRTVYDAESRDL